MEKPHNYFYKTTNLVNGKFYYGIHSTNNLNDGYLGTGKSLLKAVRKYGKENFYKEIISDYPTRKEASDHEKLIVTLELIKLEECYNIKTGGDNEFTFKHTEESKKKISESQIGHSRTKGSKRSEEVKLKIKQRMLDNPMSEITKEKLRKANIGRKLSVEARIKISKNVKSRGIDYIEKLRKANTGNKNPMYGKYHSIESKQKMSEGRLGEKHPASIKCIIFGKIYNTHTEAAKQLNIGKSTLKRRIDSTKLKWSEYKKYN